MFAESFFVKCGMGLEGERTLLYVSGTAQGLGVCSHLNFPVTGSIKCSFY